MVSSLNDIRYFPLPFCKVQQSGRVHHLTIDCYERSTDMRCRRGVRFSYQPPRHYCVTSSPRVHYIGVHTVIPCVL